MPILKVYDDSYLHYRLIPGDGEKPYLVFLHEGLGCTAMWNGFPDLLCEATGCPGFIYDRRGYGKSSPLKHKRTIHYLHEYALKELPLVLEAVIPERNFILIGHSDGGSISLIYGAEQPLLLTGIITEAAHVFVEPVTIEGIREAEKAWQNGKLKGLAKFHGDKTETIFKAWSETWLANWFKWWNIEYLLPSIEVPVLVIQGQDDQYATEAQVNAIVSRCGGTTDSEMVEHCAHSPHVDAEKAVLNIICSHIARICEK